MSLRSLTAILAASLAVTACERKTEPPRAEVETTTRPAAKAPEHVEPAQPTGPVVAVADLMPLGGSGVTGRVTFTQDVGAVKIEARVTGLTPGQHGFHVHAVGDCSAMDGTSAGDHFNPENVEHAGPDAPTAHVGDMGNLLANDNGEAMLSLQSRSMTIGSGPHDILGKSVIVHATADDLTTQPSGNSGARVACGVIQLQGAAGATR